MSKDLISIRPSLYSLNGIIELIGNSVVGLYGVYLIVSRGRTESSSLLDVALILLFISTFYVFNYKIRQRYGELVVEDGLLHFKKLKVRQPGFFNYKVYGEPITTLRVDDVVLIQHVFRQQVLTSNLAYISSYDNLRFQDSQGKHLDVPYNYFKETDIKKLINHIMSNNSNIVIDEIVGKLLSTKSLSQ